MTYQGECRGLYAPQRIGTTASYRERSAGIDADEPVGLTTSFTCQIERVILLPWFELGEPLLNRLVGEGGDP